jgi:hypothetical protein
VTIALACGAMVAATRGSEFLDRNSEREHLDALLPDVRPREIAVAGVAS